MSAITELQERIDDLERRIWVYFLILGLVNAAVLAGVAAALFGLAEIKILATATPGLEGVYFNETAARICDMNVSDQVARINCSRP